MNILKKSVIHIKTLVVYFKTIFLRPSEKKEFAFLGRITHMPLSKTDLKEVPAIPIAHSEDILAMLLKLRHRVQEMQDAIQGLSETFTIDDETATAKEFLFGRASSLSLSEDSDMAQEAVNEENLYWDHAKDARDDLSGKLIEDNQYALKLLNDESFYSASDSATSNNGDLLLATSENNASSDLFGVNEHALAKLSLVQAEQWALSWTNFQGVRQQASAKLPDLTKSLTNADEASKQFWPTIARYGLAYNLLILQKVDALQIKTLKQKFSTIWDNRLDELFTEKCLYAIDLSIFNTIEPQIVNGIERFTPGSIILLSQNPQSKALTPIAIRISGHLESSAQIYTRENATDAAWLYALQAAKTSITVYGIWLGHVYHWHIVTAVMQMTFLNNVPKNHPIYQLLSPQSDSLITFDTILLLLWSEIGPPTSISTPSQFLKLINTFATNRTFFDDDPKTTLKNLGLDEADFTINEPWDQYPIMGQYLKFWQATEEYIGTFVETTYPDDSAVASDDALRKWMAESANPGEGNIKGLPKMNDKEALTSVLTSLVYRISIHGSSRLSPTANPMLTFIANFPPCLQQSTIPEPSSEFDTKQLFEWLPKTGVIGKMITFYFIFVFSSPYKSFIPATGIESNLFFPNGLNDPRNQALVKYRQVVLDFIQAQYLPLNPPQIGQWPLNIET